MTKQIEYHRELHRGLVGASAAARHIKGSGCLCCRTAAERRWRGRLTAVSATAPTECERVGDQRADLGSAFSNASTRLRRSTKSLVVSFSTR